MMYFGLGSILFLRLRRIDLDGIGPSFISTIMDV